jgi:hypothetical protein
VTKRALCTGVQFNINPISVQLGLIQNGVSSFGDTDGNGMAIITTIAYVFRKEAISFRAFFRGK